MLICHSDSGIGDHGLAGIKSFLEQHMCNYVCKGLNLTSLGKSVATKSCSEGKGEDEDELNESDEEWTLKYSLLPPYIFVYWKE